MPNNLALQVFYGSVPLIVVLIGLYFQNQTILRDVQARKSGIDNERS